MIKLAVDAMGGDNGSKIVVEAVLNYLAEHDDVSFYVVPFKLSVNLNVYFPDFDKVIVSV